MRVTCKHCGGAHPAFECRKREPTAPSESRTRRSRSANEGLPVDTNTLRTQKASSGNADGGKPLTQTRPANSAGSSNGRTADFGSANVGSTPSPASKFDKKAWMREYMREYMRKRRAK